MVFFGAGVDAGTLPGCGGTTGSRAGGTEGNEGTGSTVGTGTAVAVSAAQIRPLAEPTGRQGKEDRPPQTQAGTASWPACVLQRFGGGYGGQNEGGILGRRAGEASVGVRSNERSESERVGVGWAGRVQGLQRGRGLEIRGRLGDQGDAEGRMYKEVDTGQFRPGDSPLAQHREFEATRNTKK